MVLVVGLVDVAVGVAVAVDLGVFDGFHDSLYCY